MITPSFFGYFNTHRGLVAAQTALSTVTQNITNANTPGYSRQRADFQAAPAYSVPGLSTLSSGQLGQGPVLQQITRSRDLFLDSQYRTANSSFGQSSSMRDILAQLEGVMSEPSTNSINNSIQSLFDSAQDMSLHPETLATRANFIQQAVDVVSVFQQQALQLADLRRNLVGDPNDPATFSNSQLAINVKDINNKLASIAEINKGIVAVKASGSEPNDLLDQRDLLLDQLSNLVDIKVTQYDNGQVDISVAGQSLIQGGKLVDTLTVAQNPGPTPDPADVPALVSTTTGGVVLNDGTGPEIQGGVVKGILDMGGNDPALSTVRGMMTKLDTLLNTIVTAVNNLQAAGRDQYGNVSTNPIFLNDSTLNPGQDLDIFHWKVNNDVVVDPKLIAAGIDDSTVAGGFAGTGDGRNALQMAQLRDLSFPALNTRIPDYLNGVISRLGVDSKSYQNSATAQGNLVQSVDLQRQSISGVNIDEETVDLLRFQRSFEATSKAFQIWDEVIKNIIDTF